MDSENQNQEQKQKGFHYEDIKVKAEDLVKTVKAIIHEGNARRLMIKNKEGEIVASFPLTAGVVGVVLAPIFAAVGALAAFMTECTITVEKKDTPDKV